MKVKYVKTGRTKNMNPKLALVLASRGLVSFPDDEQAAVIAEPEPVAPEPTVEVSPRTGLPKRVYTRRDMKAES